MVDGLSVALRAVSFVLLLQAAGTALFLAGFGNRLSSTHREARRWGCASAGLALVAVIGHHFIEAGRLAGELSGVWDASLQQVVLHSATGATTAVRVLGLALIGAGLCAGRGLTEELRAPGGGLGTTAAVAGATLIAAAFALTGHTSVSPDRWFLAAALILHVLIVAFWLGALPPLYFAARREAPAAAAKLIASFSAAATWIVPGILAAGIVLTAGLVPNLATFAKPYGELLIVKLSGFAALMGLAAANKWRLAPAIARGEPQASAALRRSIAAEYLLIAGVLSVTAVMTTLFSPE